MTGTPVQIADGIWRWTRRHPEWHADEGFAAEVVSFLVVDDSGASLIDPLLGDDPEPVWALLDAVAPSALRILITIPYHVRDAELVRDRFAGRLDVPIHGHRACLKRLRDPRGFAELTSDAKLPGGIRTFAIGSPRRFERPLWLPSQRALVFGDAVVALDDGALRVWVQQVNKAWYRERFLPTLAPLLELDAEHVLVTHGPPVIGGGRAALQAALDAPPWHHRQSAFAGE
ncbi:MAG: fold metallo-hydrolase [Solirubrobacterales bacterium]|nr:fold metallo-hydrolase [Solirubrobacterales bacterium]